MNGKYHIEKNTIQETLVIPLWGRKFATEIFGDIYQDPRAVEIAAQLDYDFGALEGKTKSFFIAIEERFSGCALVFDSANKTAVKIMLKTYVKSAGITDVTKYFYVSDPD